MEREGRRERGGMGKKGRERKSGVRGRMREGRGQREKKNRETCVGQRAREGGREKQR